MDVDSIFICICNVLELSFVYIDIRIIKSMSASVSGSACGYKEAVDTPVRAANAF